MWRVDHSRWNARRCRAGECTFSYIHVLRVQPHRHVNSTKHHRFTRIWMTSKFLALPPVILLQQTNITFLRSSCYSIFKACYPSTNTSPSLSCTMSGYANESYERHSRYYHGRGDRTPNQRSPRRGSTHGGRYRRNNSYDRHDRFHRSYVPSPALPAFQRTATVVAMHVR